MNNSERKGNLAKTITTGKPQCHKQPPGQSEQQIVPSTSSERVPHSSAEIKSMAFAYSLINTNDQRSKQIAGKLPPSVFSTSNKCSSAEIQSNAGKSYASSLKNNLDHHSTQPPGQSPLSVPSAQSSSPTPRGTVQDQTKENTKKLASVEFIDCRTGPTAAAKNFSRGKRNKWTGEYQHGSFLNEYSGNPDDPLDVTGSSSKTNTELQSTVDHGGSHSPGVDTEESKTEKTLRFCKEIDNVLQGLETKQSEYPTSSNLASVKSTEEGKQNSVNLEKEPNEFQVTYAKITEKTTLSTAWNQDRPMPVAQQDIGTQTPNNNGEKKDVTRLSVDAKNEDKTKIAHSSVPTKRNSSICTLYFDRTTDSRKTLGCPDGITSSDVSQNNLRHDVDSVLDDGKDSPMKLSEPCKADTDFDFNQIEIPNYFLKKAEKERKDNKDAYLKRVTVTVRGILVKLRNGLKQAKELLVKSQDLQNAADNLQQLLDDYKHLNNKVLPEIEYPIGSWGHLPYIEELEKFKTYLNSIDTCLQTCMKKIETEMNCASDEATQIRFMSCRIIKPLADLLNLKAQIVDLQQRLLGIPKLKQNENRLKWITQDLQVANGYCDENINICKDTEEKYAEAENLLSIDLEGVNGCDIGPLLSQFATKMATFAGLNISRLDPEKLKNCEATLRILRNKEIILGKKQEEFLAQSELQTFVSLTEVLKNQTTNFKGNEKEMTALLKSIESALQKSRIFLVIHVFKIPNADRESVKLLIREHVTILMKSKNKLKKDRIVLKVNEDLKALKVKSESLVNSSNNFGGTSCELQELISQFESLIQQYQQISTCGQEAIQTKVDSSISSLQTCITSLKQQQPIIEAKEELQTFVSVTENLKNQSTNFKGNEKEIITLIKSIESTLQKSSNFLDSHVFKIPETDRESVKSTIQENVTILKNSQKKLKIVHNVLKSNEVFEKSCLKTSTLLREVDNFRGPSSQIENLFHELTRTMNYYLNFKSINNVDLENKIKRMRKEILTAEIALKSRQTLIEAEETFENSDSQTSTLLEEIDNFWGPSYKIESLFQKINEALKYYSDFQFMGSENLKNKLANVQKRINTAQNNLKSRQPVIEAKERLATIGEQAEKLQEKVSGFKGDMSCLRNYMKEVEKLQSDLSAFNTMDNDELKKEAESVSQTIRRTLLHLESIELQFENAMAESMAVEEYTEKQAHHLEESPNMKRICNIAMQLMSIYRQLSDSGINVMDSNQLRWLNMRIGDLEDMLVNGIKPKTAQEEKAFDNAKKLCFQIQQMIANNKQCEEISPELNDIRATGMKALEYHTKIFKGDIRNNQIRWLETQLIECQTKLDRLELPEGVARESRKDVLNLCNQALSALKKHSWCKD